jgi:hypothetical protein
MADETKPREGRVIHPRLPEDLHAAVAAYAKDHDRSLQNAVIYLLRRGLDAETSD